ncbi:MAG: hypothetical protein U9O54_05205, partial [Chloroflexota bacterium]|nr:hypothetical protein [Chloroflexota bacterium]
MKTKFAIKTYLIIALISGGISTILLGVIPDASENMWLLGLSKLRVLLLIFNLLAISVLGFITARKAKDTPWTDKLNRKIADFTAPEERKTHILLTSLGGLLLGIYFIFHTITTSNPLHQSYFPHLIPWAFWAASICGETFVFLFMSDK